MTAIRPLLAGNWKMNGLRAAAGELQAMIDGLPAPGAAKADVMVCPPATLIAAFAGLAAGSPMTIGAQDCHAEQSGAHTGDISAEMLADAGARAVIAGHSERRADHGETDADVKGKAAAAHRAGLAAIVCVGETEAERKAGRALDIVSRQLGGSLPEGLTAANTIIAYEPVWAIGTGLTPTVEDVAEMHGMIRGKLGEIAAGEGAAIRILYGGSVKPANTAELMAVAHVNGALVGGASLKAADFLGILAAFG